MAGTVRKRIWTTRKGETKSAWVVYYTDQNGNRHNKACATKRAADAWLLQTQTEVRDGIHTPEASSLTVAEAIRIWLDRGERDGLERHTLLNYRTVAGLHIEPLLGGLKLAQLTTPRTVEYRDELLRTRSRRTAQGALLYFKMIVREMQRRGLVAHNAAEPVRVTARVRDRELMAIGRDVPSKEEVRLLLEACQPRWRPLLLTAVLTGMRMSELRGSISTAGRSRSASALTAGRRWVRPNRQRVGAQFRWWRSLPGVCANGGWFALAPERGTPRERQPSAWRRW
jgi:integrase